MLSASAVAWLYTYLLKLLWGEKRSSSFMLSPGAIQFGNIVVLGFGTVFFVPRVVILVEAFRSLPFLLPQTFETTWTKYTSAYWLEDDNNLLQLRGVYSCDANEVVPRLQGCTFCFYLFSLAP